MISSLVDPLHRNHTDPELLVLSGFAAPAGPRPESGESAKSDWTDPAAGQVWRLGDQAPLGTSLNPLGIAVDNSTDTIGSPE